MLSSAERMNLPIVQDELPCAQCGYLLRGLDPDGRCPECNFPIRDSLQAQSDGLTRRAIRMLLTGVITLIAILLAWPYVAQFAFSEYVPHHPGKVYVNSDGVAYLLYALLLLLPGWLFTRANPQRRLLGRLVLALPLALIVLAALMFYFINFASRRGNAILLSSYALAPFVCTIQLILLLSLLARTAQRIPRPPHRLWITLSQCALGGVLLIENLAYLPIDLARIFQELRLMTKPNNNSYLPDWWNPILQPMYSFTSYTTRPAFYVTVLMLICYTGILFRRTLSA